MIFVEVLLQRVQFVLGAVFGPIGYGGVGRRGDAVVKAKVASHKRCIVVGSRGGEAQVNVVVAQTVTQFNDFFIGLGG